MAYTVEVVDVWGSNFGTLDGAKVSKITWDVGAGSAEFTLDTNSPAAALALPGREIQIYDGFANLLWWGPIVRIRAGLPTTTWQCAGPLWYFGRRFMGQADRTNLLTNGDFEDGETGWTFVGDVAHDIDTDVFLVGTQSLRLEGATDDHSGYATQTMGPYTQSHPAGDFLTAAVEVRVDDATYLGGAIGDLGLVAIHRDNAGAPIDSGTVPFVKIDDSTPRDDWLHFEVGVPAMRNGDYLEVRLFPPHGVANFELTTVTGMESLTFWNGGVGTDVADIIAGIVAYAQDRAPFDFGHGKSDLNIDVDATATGVIRDVTYQFAEHRNIGDAINEYVRQGIVDMYFVLTPTTRTLTVVPAPMGTLTGALDYSSNLAQPFTWLWDGDSAASGVVVVGPGDGPDRPEGYASDPAGFEGLTLEAVETAPDHITVGQLDDQAAARHAVLFHPEVFELTALPGSGLIGVVKVGDTVTVYFNYGWLFTYLGEDVATYRVVRITYDPNTDQPTFALNVVAA